MYRMLIVDDEERIVNALYDLIEERFDFELHRCYSGVQAMAKIRKMRFDIIISDISMPQMSGLELLDEARKWWPKCYFIMLTAYSSFDYAYQTLKHERVDYVLKLESYDVVCDIIAKKRSLIEQDRRAEERLQHYDRSLQDLKQGMQRYFVKRIIVLGTPLPEQSDLDAVSLLIRLRDPLLLVLVSMSMKNPVDQRQTATMLDDYVNGQLAQYGLRSFSYVDNGSIVYAVQSIDDTLRTQEEMCVHTHAVFENLPQIAEELTGQRLAALCADHFVSWQDAHTLYRCGMPRLESMRNECGMMVLTVEEELRQMDGVFPNMDELYLLWELIRDDNLAGVEETLRQAEATLSQGGHGGAKIPDMTSTALGFLVQKAAQTYAPDSAKWNEWSALMHGRGESVDEYMKRILDALKEISDIRSASQASRSTWLIERVHQYIDAHYAEDITLTQMAEVMHYSPSYLSRFYKQNTGINLMNHLYDVRIAKGKELLASSNLKVSEIAIATGFCSSKYFNRVFKKQVGISAVQYREKHGRLPVKK